MLSYSLIICFAAAFALTLGGIAVFLRFAPKGILFDVPNARSTHSSPVRRGGGIVVLLVTVLLFASFSLWHEAELDLIYIGAALAIGMVGFADDVRSVPTLPRLLVQIAAAAIVVWHSGGFPGAYIPVADLKFPFGVFSPVISVIYIVWTINAYNFMDGIDGMLVSQSFVAALSWAGLGVVTGWYTGGTLGATIAGSCLGFLSYNWHPARVFMGDVGSMFLGFVISSVPLMSSRGSSLDGFEALTFSILFSFLFHFDTIQTRVTRFFSAGWRFWEPNRDHLYQRLHRGGVSQAAIVGSYAAPAVMISALSTAGSVAGKVYWVASGVAGVISSIALAVWARKKNIDLSGG